MNVYVETKVLQHGPILCRGQKVLQQISKLCIATSSLTVFPYRVKAISSENLCPVFFHWIIHLNITQAI